MPRNFAASFSTLTVLFALSFQRAECNQVETLPNEIRGFWKVTSCVLHIDGHVVEKRLDRDILIIDDKTLIELTRTENEFPTAIRNELSIRASDNRKWEGTIRIPEVSFEANGRKPEGFSECPVEMKLSTLKNPAKLEITMKFDNECVKYVASQLEPARGVLLVRKLLELGVHCDPDLLQFLRSKVRRTVSIIRKNEESNREKRSEKTPR